MGRAVSMPQAEQGRRLEAAALLSSLFTVRSPHLLLSELKQPHCESG